MSQKNRPLEKKARAMERAIRKGRVPTLINLVQWLKDHKHAQTTGEAVRLIKAGRVMSESHKLNGDKIIERQELNKETGKEETKKYKIFNPLYSSSLRPTLRFITAKD